jgi:Fe-S cluster assembly protein SufD
MSTIDILKQDFEHYRAQADGSAFAEQREAAFGELQQLGIPTIKHEEWKYTNLKFINDINFQASCIHTEAARNYYSEHIVQTLKANRLVFINGSFDASLTQLQPEDAGIVMTNLAAARKNHSDVFNAHFGKYAEVKGHAMNAMNTALMSDGAFIHVPAGKQTVYPIIITNISDASEVNVLNQPRNLIVVDKNAGATVIESFFALGSNASFCNIVNEVYVGENANLEHYKLQRLIGEHYQNNFTQVFQEANTHINQVTLTLDGKFVRNTLHFYMNGQNCNTLLYGLYLLDGNQFVDNHTRVDHAMPNCFSDEKYKGILKDKSTAVFNGKIMVHLDAQKTNAYQRNQNILLSDEATVNTKPQLEIFADDVKCTHGATIGQLDEEPMFYMRSRGIPENVARKLLLNAFADDIAEKIKIPELVAILEEQIEKKI